MNDNQLHLLFGIPYHTPSGLNEFIFDSDINQKIFRIDIQKKEYATQNIKINKFKKKTKKELDRIYRESKEISLAKKIKYNHYPDINFIIPVEGIVTGVFGTQRFYNGEKGKYHNGHDIAAKTGTPIFAPSSGKVILTGHYYYNGKFVMMNHGNNLISIFLHMDTINVQEGIVLKKGDLLGTVGSTGLSTGPHLHWSVTLNNTYIDPLELVNNYKAELDK